MNCTLNSYSHPGISVIMLNSLFLVLIAISQSFHVKPYLSHNKKVPICHHTGEQRFWGKPEKKKKGRRAAESKMLIFYSMKSLTVEEQKSVHVINICMHAKPEALSFYCSDYSRLHTWLFQVIIRSSNTTSLDSVTVKCSCIVAGHYFLQGFLHRAV